MIINRFRAILKWRDRTNLLVRLKENDEPIGSHFTNVLVPVLDCTKAFHFHPGSVAQENIVSAVNYQRNNRIGSRFTSAFVLRCE